MATLAQRLDRNIPNITAKQLAEQRKKHNIYLQQCLKNIKIRTKLELQQRRKLTTPSVPYFNNIPTTFFNDHHHEDHDHLDYDDYKDYRDYDDCADYEEDWKRDPDYIQWLSEATWSY